MTRIHTGTHSVKLRHSESKDWMFQTESIRGCVEVREPNTCDFFTLFIFQWEWVIDNKIREMI